MFAVTFQIKLATLSFWRSSKASSHAKNAVQPGACASIDRLGGFERCVRSARKLQISSATNDLGLFLGGVMPVLLEHIDAIGRKRQRDVLFLAFKRTERPHREDYRTLEIRQKILQWFDDQSIAWHECGPYASETTWCSYAREVFIDVPFDPDDLQYQKVQTFLEHTDGTGRFDDVKFYVVTLDFAMRNAHHDEPGFWEKWADNL
jgi:hypothetical protein